VRTSDSLESGFTLAETLIVVAIVAAVVLFGASSLSGSHAGTRSQTMAQILGLVNRAHNLASANGATLQVAPSATGPGSDVTIFDAHKELGGLNTYGIVPFRLSAEIAIWEAQQVIDLGVDVVAGAHVGGDGQVEWLLKDFDAVVLACGMGGVPKLGIAGEELEGVYDALDVIERAKMGQDVGRLGNHVAVIGAGNTAIDALTCSKRLGAERVTMYYRRSEDDMTAYPFEYEFAKQEGVEFRWLCAPKRIIGTNGAVSGVEFVRTQRQAVDGGARRPPASLPGSEFVVAADTVIRAIGQSRRTELFDQFGVKHDGAVVQVDEHLETSRPRVYAAGDCIFAKGSREAMVVEAAEQGKIAARSIDGYLNRIATGAK